MAKQELQQEVTSWVGWVYFAGFMLMVAGIFHTIAGLLALFKDDVVLVTAKHLVLVDYTQWGWVQIALGIIMLTGSMSLFSGKGWGRFVGATAAIASAAVNLAFIGSYPFWSVLALVVDVVVVYAIVAHGGELKKV